LISEKSSPLKQLSQMNQTLVGSILYKDCSFSSDKEKIVLEINQSETRMACGGHVCYPIGTK
jgi:hypothetical protein